METTKTAVNAKNDQNEASELTREEFYKQMPPTIIENENPIKLR